MALHTHGALCWKGSLLLGSVATPYSDRMDDDVDSGQGSVPGFTFKAVCPSQLPCRGCEEARADAAIFQAPGLGH